MIDLSKLPCIVCGGEVISFPESKTLPLCAHHPDRLKLDTLTALEIAIFKTQREIYQNQNVEYGFDT